MHARVATYHGADAAGIDRLLEETGPKIAGQVDSPPEGLEGIREVVLLVDRDSGRALVITFFETEDDLRRADATLERTPMSQAGGVRTGVERYEVALRRARDRP